METAMGTTASNERSCEENLTDWVSVGCVSASASMEQCKQRKRILDDEGEDSKVSSPTLLKKKETAITKMARATPNEKGNQKTGWRRRRVLFISGGVVISLLAAALVVLYISFVYESYHYDPYTILNISDVDRNAPNITKIIKKAYRQLALRYQPEYVYTDFEDIKRVEQVIKAYSVLQYEEGETFFTNYQRYGHPDGSPSTRTWNFCISHLYRPSNQ